MVKRCGFRGPAQGGPIDDLPTSPYYRRSVTERYDHIQNEKMAWCTHPVTLGVWKWQKLPMGQPMSSSSAAA